MFPNGWNPEVNFELLYLQWNHIAFLVMLPLFNCHNRKLSGGLILENLLFFIFLKKFLILKGENNVAI